MTIIIYFQFVTMNTISETAIRVFRRHRQCREATQVLAKCVNNPDFVSKAGIPYVLERAV